MYMDKDGVTLASEILAELKASARRWFIAFCIMLILEAVTIGGFLWYISLPVEEALVTQETSGDSNKVVGIGGIEDGSETNGGV